MKVQQQIRQMYNRIHQMHNNKAIERTERANRMSNSRVNKAYNNDRNVVSAGCDLSSGPIIPAIFLLLPPFSYTFVQVL
jgi:hypothetical protein